MIFSIFGVGKILAEIRSLAYGKSSNWRTFWNSTSSSVNPNHHQIHNDLREGDQRFQRPPLMKILQAMVEENIVWMYHINITFQMNIT